MTSLVCGTESTRPKRPRSSLACIRCRKKKVKCDFVQPTCGRCSGANLACNYATPPRRVDGLAFDQVGSNIQDLKGRMQRMYRELSAMRDNMHPFFVGKFQFDHQNNNEFNQQVRWKISFAPSGLRIDTNIANVTELYRILLSGIRQLNINHDPSSNSLFNVIGNKSRSTIQQTTWEKNDHRLWEVNDFEAQKVILEKQEPQATADLPEGTLSHLMKTCYHSCFLAYQILDKDEFMAKYDSGQLEPLLVNSIHAWVFKHGCIYHNIPHTQKDAATIGEAYFSKARRLLEKRFDQSNFTTIQALLNLYMYQLSSDRSSLAYLYIGLAIRMAQDLKLHKTDYMPQDPKERERNKRLWWSAYWLDLDAALESNRPTMVDDKDIDIDYPKRLETEDQETGYRIEFSVQFIKLMRIRKDIAKHLPSEQSGQSLLSAISRLEAALTNWLHEMPHDLKYDPNIDNAFVKAGSFRDEARLILNIAYQTTWIMLHKFFLPEQNTTASPVALLSLNICTKSANSITKMLQTYAAQCHWCYLFYALNGIVASVAIHRLNVLLKEDEETASVSQRHLLLTAHILRKSPLIRKEKVIKIVESIQGFCKENNLSMNLSQFEPYVDEHMNPAPIQLSTESISYINKTVSKPSKSRRKNKDKEKPTSNTESILLTDPNSSLVNFNIQRMNNRKAEPDYLLNDKLDYSSSISSNSSLDDQQNTQNTIDLHTLLMSDVMQSLLYNTQPDESDNRIYLTNGQFYSNRKRSYQE